MSPKHRYDPDIIRIRQLHPPNPAVTTGMNGGPRDYTLITALQNKNKIALHLYTHCIDDIMVFKS
jgi:hypothetical protein